MNYKVQKFFAIFILAVLLVVASSSYYGIQGIDNLAYVVAIGLDAGKDNNIKLSLQISVPNGGEGGSSSSSQSSSSLVNTIECSSISTGIALFNSYLGKEVNLSHCKIIVFSEEIAVTGILEHVSVLASDREIRPDCNVLVSKCKAKDFLENSIPTLTNLTPRYYEILLNCGLLQSQLGGCRLW